MLSNRTCAFPAATTRPSATLPVQQTSLPRNGGGDSSAALSHNCKLRGIGTSPTRGPERAGRIPEGRSRDGRRRRAGLRGGARRSSNTRGAPIIEQWQNCHGQTGPPNLKADTPSLQRLIYDLRWQYRDHKGEDLWSQIQQNILNATGTEMSVAALQMKYARSRIEDIEWLDQDARTRSLSPTASFADHLFLEIYPLPGLAPIPAGILLRDTTEIPSTRRITQHGCKCQRHRIPTRQRAWAGGRSIHGPAPRAWPGASPPRGYQQG